MLHNHADNLNVSRTISKYTPVYIAIEENIIGHFPLFQRVHLLLLLLLFIVILLLY